MGTWEIIDKQLYLKSLQGKYTLNSAPIEANWFSGQLVIPESGKGEYFHGGWGHDYAQNKIITIVNGVIANIEYQDKTAPSFLDEWVKARLNRTFGAIAEASDDCWTQLDESDDGNKLIIFSFQQKSLLETMTGKLLISAQDNKVALPISTCLAQPNLVNGNESHILAVSVSLGWSMELEKMFISRNWGNDDNSIGNINGVWHFSVKEEQEPPKSGNDLWEGDIPF